MCLSLSSSPLPLPPASEPELASSFQMTQLSNVLQKVCFSGESARRSWHFPTLLMRASRTSSHAEFGGMMDLWHTLTWNWDTVGMNEPMSNEQWAMSNEKGHRHDNCYTGRVNPMLYCTNTHTTCTKQYDTWYLPINILLLHIFEARGAFGMTEAFHELDVTEVRIFVDTR